MEFKEECLICTKKKSPRNLIEDNLLPATLISSLVTARTVNLFLSHSRYYDSISFPLRTLYIVSLKLDPFRFLFFRVKYLFTIIFLTPHTFFPNRPFLFGLFPPVLQFTTVYCRFENTSSFLITSVTSSYTIKLPRKPNRENLQQS